MQKSNSYKLFSSCPIIFRAKAKGVKENLMCFGFECGDGWFDIIYELSNNIERIAETMKSNGVDEEELPVVVQVKEKFGSLRFYMRNATSDIQELINQCERSSAMTCERCGKPGAFKRHHGWFLTVCDTCENSDEK